MNIKSLDESLFNQLKRILDTMRNSGRKPLRIYMTYGQMQALRVELQHYNRYPADKGIRDIRSDHMEFFGIPVELSPAGAGLYVSCLTDIVNGK